MPSPFAAPTTAGSAPSLAIAPEALQKSPEAQKAKALSGGISADTIRAGSKEDRIKAVKAAFNFK